MQRDNVRRDWANLPEDLIVSISVKTTANVTYIRLRAVCKAWRRALTPHPRHLLRQTPWLLLPRPGDINDFLLRFYDLSQSKTHRFELPYIKGKRICGSSYGWLVLKRNNVVSLYNPITKSSRELPSLNRLPNMTIHPSYPKHSRQHCTEKVVLSCNPTEPDCIVVSCAPDSSPVWEVVFCRIGDIQWTGLKKRERHRRLVDFTCFNKSVYTVNNKKEVSVFDLQTLASWTYPALIKYCAGRHYINLVEGDEDSGGPFVVYSRPCPLEIDNNTYVYKWFNDLKRWDRVKDIGKSVLFLSRDDCYNIQLEEMNGNGIYYGVRHSLPDHSFRVNINQVNLKSGGDVLHNHSPLDICPIFSGESWWFTPSLISLDIARN